MLAKLMMNRRGGRLVPPLAWGVLSLFALLVTVYLLADAWRLHRAVGLSQEALDLPLPTAHEIAGLMSSASQYLMTLSMASLGGVGFLISNERIGPRLMKGRRRTATVLAALGAAVSLVIGFVTQQALVVATSNGQVRAVREYIWELHMRQLFMLAASVLLLAGVVLTLRD